MFESNQITGIKMKKVLFINQTNTARTQMAEGLVNHFLKNDWQAYSAGVDKTIIKSLAISVMKDIGIDISHQISKTILSIHEEEFDLIIDLCDQSRENCPFFPSCDIIHYSFIDPTDLGVTSDEKYDSFCYIRDQIKEWVIPFLKKYKESF